MNMHAVHENSAFRSYLLIGGGRVSRHFQFYFESLSLPFSSWSRSQGREALAIKALEASHVLLLIPDSAIEEFHSEHHELHDRICVHFSGALVSDRLPGAHPLMTFSDRLYDLEIYRQLPFVLEKGRGSMAELLPGLPNPSVALDPEKKKLYHSLCAMAGNFTVILWEKVFVDFEIRLGLPKHVLLPYLLQTTENLSLSPMGTSVLTGPLVRGDQSTVTKHLEELAGDPFAGVYEAFVKAHAAQSPKGGTR
jgi:2-dehydropantoate 2-reductase